MVVKPTIVWEGDDKLRQRILRAPEKVHARMRTITEFHSLKLETVAKVEAPWTDRTGNARSGIATQTHSPRAFGGGDYGMTVYHQVPYGFYLETISQGRWGTIAPSVSKIAPQYYAAVQSVMGAI